jgi:hypothetical protein
LSQSNLGLKPQTANFWQQYRFATVIGVCVSTLAYLHLSSTGYQTLGIFQIVQDLSGRAGHLGIFLLSL